MPLWEITITRTEWTTTLYVVDLNAEDEMSAEDLFWEGLNDGLITEREPDDGDTLSLVFEAMRKD